MQWNPRWASLRNKQKLVRYFGFSVLPSANKPYRWATDDQLESMNERMGYVLLIVVTDSIYFVASAGLLFADGRLYYIIQMQTRLHLRTSPSAVHPATHSRPDSHFIGVQKPAAQQQSVYVRGLQSPLDGPWYWSVISLVDDESIQCRRSSRKLYNK